MPPQAESSNLSVSQFAERYRREMIPLRKPFSYLAASLPLTEDDIKEYLEEPIAALPPALLEHLPKISILLVPYLEKTARSGRDKEARSAEMVCLEKPSDSRACWTSQSVSKDETVLAFAVKDQEIADYHYRFYQLLATVIADHWEDDPRAKYSALLRDELSANTHGEVDEESWRLKQALVRRQSSSRRETKLFREYARQSFIDTLTLYLHGICCDIDVETGPRQLPSRLLRRRLKLLQSLYAPPEGYAVFPEEARGTEPRT